MVDPNVLALHNPHLPLTESYWQWLVGFWAAFDQAAGIGSTPSDTERTQPDFCAGYYFGMQGAGLEEAVQATPTTVALDTVLPCEARWVSESQIQAAVDTIATTGDYTPICVRWQYQEIKPFWFLREVTTSPTWYALQRLGHDQIKVVFSYA